MRSFVIIILTVSVYLSGALAPVVGQIDNDGGKVSKTIKNLQRSLPKHIRLLIPPAENPLPLVVWASGCSGFFHPRAPWHFLERSQHIISAGYAIAFVDYVSAAGLKSACAGEMSIEQVGKYLVEAIRSLKGHPELDLKRIVLLGGSLGGGGVLSALSVKGIEMQMPIAALSIYPACIGLKSWNLEVPVWVWFAGGDRITPLSKCQPAIKNAGGTVNTHTFPDVQHAFDMKGLPTKLEPEQAAIAYNDEAATQLWERVNDVLKTIRKKGVDSMSKTTARLPIIDMHLHGGYKAGWFATEPDGTPLRRFCFPEPCFHAPAAIKKAEDILTLTLESMKKHNIVLGVVSDQPPVFAKWKAADPKRLIFGFSLNQPTEIDIPKLRKHFTTGEVQIMGELSFQYGDIAIDDPLLDPVFALAEELNVPVHIHLGGLGGGAGFPIHKGNPLRLSKVLRKYPKLHIYLENASWPFLEEVTALMYIHPNVYADLSTISWIIPRETFHAYLKGLVQNGLSKRLMFGSDQMMWPESIALAIEAIETADFLTEEQKRDIFYNNAARFLRLDKKTIARHHGEIKTRNDLNTK